MYVYIQSEPGLYTVGYYDANNKWQPESDHADREQAAERVCFLNGDKTATPGAIKVADKNDYDTIVFALKNLINQMQTGLEKTSSEDDWNRWNHYASEIIKAENVLEKLKMT